MNTLAAWMAGALIYASVALADYVDRHNQPETCVAEIKDAGGNVHMVSGKVASVSVD